jgi:hypothetical protein
VVVASDEPNAVEVDVEGTAPSLGVVDTLARLQLVARRNGSSIRLRNPSPALCDFIELVGLTDVLLLEAGRKPECREELGIEEVVQPGDPSV